MCIGPNTDEEAFSNTAASGDESRDNWKGLLNGEQRVDETSMRQNRRVVDSAVLRGVNGEQRVDGASMRQYRRLVEGVTGYAHPHVCRTCSNAIISDGNGDMTVI